MKKISVLKLSALLAGIFAANAAIAAFPEGYWKADYYQIGYTYPGYSVNVCIKADKTLAVTDPRAANANGFWTLHNTDILLHTVEADPLSWKRAYQMHRVDSTHLTGWVQSFTSYGTFGTALYNKTKWTYQLASCPV
jgi:hypothetical protein